MQQADSARMALVVVSYDSQYPDPITMNIGDQLKIVKRTDEGRPGWVFCESQTLKKGWVPENSIKINGESAVALQNYVAREISVMEGEIVRIETVESGWAWVTGMTNETGWVPLKNLKIVD
jgi:hypothetical protein